MSKLRGPGKRPARTSGRGFLVEPLEGRTLLTTLPVLTVNGTSGNDSISLSNSGVFEFQVNLNSTITRYLYTSYSGVQINGVGGNDTISILAIGLPTTVVGAGQDTVILGDSNGVQDITAPVTITDPPSYAALTVDDSGDTTGRNATISDTSITNLGPAAINYHAADLSSLTINGGSDGNTFTVTNTPHGLSTTPTYLNSGIGPDQVNIQGTGSSTVLNLQGQSSHDTLNISNAGSTQGILGAINVKNDGSFDALTIDDSADTTARTATFSTFTPGGDTAWESLTGLAPASIDYRAADVNSATFDGGSGSDGNTFNVFGIAAGFNTGVPTNLNTGNGTNNIVNIATTAAGTVLNVQGQGFHENVNVTNAGSVQSVLGTVNISSVQAISDFLLVDDSADATPRTVALGTFTPMGDTEWESLTGLAPGTINYKMAQAGSFTINGGSGGNTFTIDGLGNPLDGVSLKTGTGADHVNILATDAGSNLDVDGQDGIDTVSVTNAGSVQGIQGSVFISNDSSFDVVTIDDSADSVPATVYLYTIPFSPPYGAVSFFPSQQIAYQASHVYGPATIKGGSGGNTYYVSGSVDSVDLYSGSGNDQVNIQDIPVGSDLNVDGQSGLDSVNVGDAGSLQGIQGVVNIKNTAAYDVLTIDDSAGPNVQNANLSSFVPSGDSTYELVTGLAPGPISFRAADMDSVTINAGSGANTLYIDALAAGGFDNYILNTGAGNDTINVHATDAATALTVNTQGGSDTINLDFTSGNPLPHLLNLSGLFTLTGLIAGRNLNGTTLNLNRSTVYINYGSPLNDPLALIKSYLKTGYANGAWTGAATALTGAINSSPAASNPKLNTAIGYADSADGTGVDPVPNSILLKYTLYGDANLDGQVNSTDLQILLFGLNKPGAWDQGDFNYDGNVNSADLQALLFTLNTALGNQAAPAGLQASSSTLASTPPPSKSLFNLTTYVATAGPVLPPPAHHKRHGHGNG